MSSNLRFGLLLALALVAVPACGSGEAARTGPDVYHVTHERHGDRIGLVPGQQLSVVLPSLAGSASKWTPTSCDETVLQRASGTRTVGGRQGGMIIGGSKAYEQILFRAVGTGATRLELQRVRTEREGGGVVTFRIDVVVGGS